MFIWVKPASYNLSIFLGKREPFVVIPIDFIESNYLISEIISKMSFLNKGYNIIKLVLIPLLQ